MQPEFSRPVTVDSFSSKEKFLRIEANSEERINLAKRFKLPEISNLQAEFKIKPLKGDEEWRVRGKVSAVVQQVCVITLEVFLEEIMEEFETIFSIHADPEEDNEEIDMESLDDPEAVIDGMIDFGELAAQHLSLVLDPFPKKPGVVFEGFFDEEEEASPKVQPFVGLAALLDKKRTQ